MTDVSIMTPECRVLRPHLTVPNSRGLYDCTFIFQRDDAHHVWGAILSAAKLWKGYSQLLYHGIIAAPLRLLPRYETTKMPKAFDGGYFMRTSSATMPEILGDQKLGNGSIVTCACTFSPIEQERDRKIAVRLDWIEPCDVVLDDISIWQSIPYYGAGHVPARD